MLTVLEGKEQTVKSWDVRRKLSSKFHVSDIPYSACHSSLMYLPSCVVLGAG